MKVLLLEDRGSISVPLAELLTESGNEVFQCFNALDALSCWESADILIVDLNMPSDGLTDDQQKESAIGLFTGWIWLRDYVFPKKPQVRNATIIISAYIDELKRFANDEELSKICIIRKDSNDFIKKVLDKVEYLSSRR